MSLPPDALPNPEPDPAHDPLQVPGADPAAARFAMLQLMRLAGALLLVTGVLLASGKMSWLPKLPVEAGYMVSGSGFITFFALPQMLARRWKSKP